MQAVQRGVLGSGGAEGKNVEVVGAKLTINHTNKHQLILTPRSGRECSHENKRSAAARKATKLHLQMFLQETVVG